MSRNGELTWDFGNINYPIDISPVLPILDDTLPINFNELRFEAFLRDSTYPQRLVQVLNPALLWCFQNNKLHLLPNYKHGVCLKEEGLKTALLDSEFKTIEVFDFSLMHLFSPSPILEVYHANSFIEGELRGVFVNPS